MSDALHLTITTPGHRPGRPRRCRLRPRRGRKRRLRHSARPCRSADRAARLGRPLAERRRRHPLLRAARRRADGLGRPARRHRLPPGYAGRRSDGAGSRSPGVARRRARCSKTGARRADAPACARRAPACALSAARHVRRRGIAYIERGCAVSTPRQPDAEQDRLAEAARRAAERAKEGEENPEPSLGAVSARSAFSAGRSSCRR